MERLEQVSDDDSAAVVPEDFEDMVRALSHGHDRLSAVQRLMERLEQVSDDDSAAVVPEDFMMLWNAFRTVLDEQGRTDA